MQRKLWTKKTRTIHKVSSNNLLRRLMRRSEASVGIIAQSALVTGETHPCCVPATKTALRASALVHWSCQMIWRLKSGLSIVLVRYLNLLQEDLQDTRGKQTVNRCLLYNIVNTVKQYIYI